MLNVNNGENLRSILKKNSPFSVYKKKKDRFVTAVTFKININVTITVGFI